MPLKRSIQPGVVAGAAIALALGGSVLFAQNRGAVPASPDTRTVVHVLNRIGFGARPGDVERVRALGLAKYIDQQLDPRRVDNQALEERLASFATLEMSASDLTEKYFRPAIEMRRDQALQAQRAAARATPPASPEMNGEAMAPNQPPPDPAGAALPPEARMAQAAAQTVLNELMQAKMLRATLSERQLEEVLTDFWFNHFNVFVGKGQVRQYLTAYERDTIRPNVLGRFRTLLGAVAHSPAMLFYLDNFQSAAPNAALLTRPDATQRLDNPRLTPDQRRQMLERMEQLRQQPGRGARGLNENYAREIMELHTLGVDAGYTQQDVVELARILTGWTIDRPQLGGAFVFRPAIHDNGTKHFLGVTFTGNGESEGEKALDLLAQHPATARHISYKLAQRFIADEPPPALVDRAAKVFMSTKGDLRDVVRAVITSPEFFDTSTVRAKVKTPLEFVVSAVRATGAAVNNSQPMVVAMRNLGMPLYGCQPPTGYSMTADAWVNTGSLLNRMNFAVQLVSGGRVEPTERPGRLAPPAATRPQRPNGRGQGPVAVDLASLAPDTTDETRDRVIAMLLAGQASDATRQTLARAESPASLIALVLGSPEFQRR